jgi:hypothetical protein
MVMPFAPAADAGGKARFFFAFTRRRRHFQMPRRCGCNGNGTPPGASTRL